MQRTGSFSHNIFSRIPECSSVWQNMLFALSTNICWLIPSIKSSLYKTVFLIIIFVLSNIQFSYSAITIQSIATTSSTCGNNGTATILAKSTKANPVLFYEIISGPSLAPIQNTPLFSSLFPGTYVLRVYDIDFEFKEQEIKIEGSYELPDLIPKVTNPLCAGSSNGSIIGQPVSGKGKEPFVWELISSSSTVKQSADVFTNLPPGNYNIKLTDACGNYQTRAVVISKGGSGLAHASDGIPTISKIKCDTMQFLMQIKLLKENAKNPLTLSLTRGDGSVTTKTFIATPVDTVNYIPGLYSITELIPDITYNEYLHACIKDVCGYEICATRDSIAPFTFDVQFNTSYNSCTNKLTAMVVPASITGTPYMKTGFQTPVSLTLRNAASNSLSDSTGCNRSFCTLSLKEQTAGENYNLRIVDGCGSSFQRTIQWPTPVVLPEAVRVSIDRGCLDSTAVASFNLTNFGSPVTIKILSGPASVGSTKPGYEFSYPITYPKTFYANRATRYSIKNMAAGIYTYSVTDTCGNTFDGNFEVRPSNLSNLFYSYSVTKGCVGNNVLYFNPVSINAVGLIIKNTSTNIELYKRIGRLTFDSIINLDPGKYLFQIYYGNVPGYSTQPYNNTITDGPLDCWLFSDTIRVPEYSNNSFQSNTSIFCNNISYVEINVDSSRGVAPYQYEISSGPTTFPLQYSNVFQLATYGDYVIRIRDACSNSNTQQISVDSAKFSPILKVGGTCRGNRIVLKAISSAFFEYDWKKPDGSLYTGDSIIINALSPSDTGIYTIAKKVSINGCTDTFFSTYHLELRDVYRQTISFCEGSAVTIDSEVFTASGTYTDTLKNQAGCDSIRIITLNMRPQKIDTVAVRICNGESIRIGTNTYNSPGFYKDSVLNVFGCYEITVTKLDVNGYPEIFQKSICENEKLQVGIHSYTQTGIYSDTIRSSFGCDSVVITDLTVVPLKRTTVKTSICTGDSITVGNHIYRETGIYQDTLTTVTCDSIVTLELTILFPGSIFTTDILNHCFDEEPAILTANWGEVFTWTPSGETTQSIQITAPGIYSVLATDQNQCTSTEKIQVTNFCETKIFVPTGFTPNGDGLHDDVEIFGKNFTAFKITIFNRWGEVIFVSTDKNIRWDGTYKGQEMPSGSYPWMINYQSTVDTEHSEQVLKGSITLVR